MGNSLNCFNEPFQKPPASNSATEVEVLSEEISILKSDSANEEEGLPSEEISILKSDSANEEEGLPSEEIPVIELGITVEGVKEISKETLLRVEGVEDISEETLGSESALTLEEVIDSLTAVFIVTDLKKFVLIIKQMLEAKKSDKESTRANVKEDKGSISASAEENSRIWTSFVTSGAKFLEFLKGHTEKIEEKDSFSSWNSTVVAQILEQIGLVYWAVGGLAITAYLIENFGKVFVNKVEGLELLTNMVDLATTAGKLRDMIPDEEEEEILKKAVMVVVQGSIVCVSQRESENILKDLSTTLQHLNLEMTTKLLKRKRFCKKDAVGIVDAKAEVIELLKMTTEDEEKLMVVIYGFGGIGKTTLATSVLDTLNLDSFNYAMVQLSEKTSKTDLKKMQELILKNAFPNFHSKAIMLRDCEEGRDRLTKAFQCQEDQPVFLFIDNVLRSEDLETIFPQDLKGLPKRSRILLTTRTLNVTDIFLTSGIKRCSFAMRTLNKEDAEKILCKDRDNPEVIKYDIERILWICGGVPLALKIVSGHLGHLGHMGYNKGEKCCHILDALKEGRNVKEKNLSRRLLDFVYNELEEATQNAFLDICCFFNGWIRRHVEYILGASEVKLLIEAALINPFVYEEDTEGIYAGEDRLLVPNILRARGRRLSASTRFTDVETFREAAQDNMRLKGIKGIWFEDSCSKYVLEVKHLNTMRHSLRIMSLGRCMTTSAQSPMKFEELRYLKVGAIDVPHPPMKLEELDMLGIFDGPYKIPNGISMNKLPKRLRMIRASQASTSKEPSSSSQGIRNHSLEELHLRGWNRKRLPEGLRQLRSLKILGLDYYEIEEFPEQICKLSSLIKLSIVGWGRLKRLPESFGRLKGLSHLEISHCHELEKLPSSFGQLTALEHLSLVYCPGLKQLPGSLESLKYLNFFFDTRRFPNLVSSTGGWLPPQG